MLHYLLILLSLVLCELILKGFSADDEERLVKDLLKGYNKLTRPVPNDTQVINVEFTIALFQLINMDEKNQVMKTNVWLQMRWADFLLQWDPAEYGGIDAVRLPPDKLWKPDIVLFNNADGNYEVQYKPNAVVYSSGFILFIPSSIYKSSCTIEVTYFPFDEQSCEMQFRSWTYHADEVSLSFFKNISIMTVNDYILSGSWDLLEAPGYINIIPDESPDESAVTHITFIMALRRKTLFYTINLITPCVLISFLSVLLFYLPTDAGEKITLGISILLSLIVFLVLVSKMLPPNSKTMPLISKYLLFIFIMNIISLLVTVLIISWNHRGPSTHVMPEWVKLVFLKVLPKFLSMPRPNERRYSLRIANKQLMTTFTTSINQLETEFTGHLATKSGINSHNFENGFQPADYKMNKAIEAVDYIVKVMQADDEENKIKADWKYVALVIDRLQLYLFFIVTAVGTVGLLMNAPHIFESIDQQAIIDKMIAITE